MSDRRRGRAEAEFFMYEPGAVVPGDVTHLLVPPGVEVLPAEVFRFKHLREVVLPEGLREIGQHALEECTSLEHVSLPSTLVKIGDCALSGCILLTTLHISKGLLEIGHAAFFGCTSLTRIFLPSTVATIGDGAFSRCSSLAVVILMDGLRTIGHNAFRRCALEDIILPTTLTEIGPFAFGFCGSLRMVKLCGGIQLISDSTFDGCNLLDYVRVTPKCLIVTITGENYDFDFATDGTIVSETTRERVVISSECFHSMSAAEVSQLEIAIAEILQMQLDWGDKHQRLHALLAPHERRRKEEVAGLLKLGVREAEMRRSGAMSPGIGNETPLTCRMDVIVEHVVAFLCNKRK